MMDEFVPRMTRSELDSLLEDARDEVRGELMPDVGIREAIVNGDWRDTVDPDYLDGFFSAELLIRLRDVDLTPEEKERIRAADWNTPD